MIFIAYMHTLKVSGVSLSKVLEYQGKTENILENIFCIETVLTLTIFDILYYLTKISCQVHSKNVF